VYLIVNKILQIVIADYGTLHAIFYRWSDVLCWPRCAGEMRFISFITDPQLIRHILEHLGLWVQRPSRDPPSQDLSLGKVPDSL